MKKRFNITVKGEVQGVWYRKSTQSEAKKLELTGFVKNMSNGDVYIEAEGDEQTLKTFLDWTKQGPEKAVVEDVSVQEEKPKKFKDFKIVH